MNNIPSLQELFEGSPFDIIDTPWGHIERWRASTLATGSMGALSSVYDIVRADAAASQARADAEQAREALTEHLCNQVTELSRRFDDLEARLTAAEDKRRADEAAQRRLDEEEIELPPDFDRPQDLPPAKIEDEAAMPGGELHSIVPKEEPPLDDSEGDLPPELVEEPEPVPEPKGSVLPPPTALFGN